MLGTIHGLRGTAPPASLGGNAGAGCVSGAAAGTGVAGAGSCARAMGTHITAHDNSSPRRFSC